mgnify:CR=1 FL=1
MENNYLINAKLTYTDNKNQIVEMVLCQGEFFTFIENGKKLTIYNQVLGYEIFTIKTSKIISITKA